MIKVFYNSAVENRPLMVCLDPSTTCAGVSIVSMQDTTLEFPSVKANIANRVEVQEGQILWWGGFTLKGKNPYARCVQLVSLMKRSFGGAQGYGQFFGWLAAETQFSGKNSSTVAVVARAHGWGEVVAAAFGVPNKVEISPAELKKLYQGKGNATKEDMIRAVEQKHGYNLATFPKATQDNVADAVALAHVCFSELQQLDVRGELKIA